MDEKEMAILERTRNWLFMAVAKRLTDPKVVPPEDMANAVMMLHEYAKRYAVEGPDRLSGFVDGILMQLLWPYRQHLKSNAEVVDDHNVGVH